MKRIIKLFGIAAALTVFAVPVLAQECTDDSKAAMYKTFLDKRTGEAADQKIAADSARQYLKCSTDPTEQIAAYLTKWLKKYDDAMGSLDTKKQLEAAYTKKNYPEAVRLGKQAIQNEADFTTGYILIGLSGYYATTSGNMSLLPDAQEAAIKALEQLEAGKPFAPFASKDAAEAWMNYVIGKAKLKDAPVDAIPYILKAAHDPDLKKFPGLYIDLAQAYGNGPLAKLAQDYDAKYKGKDESPESKLALANIYQMIDRQIDALARATALAVGSDKTTYMAALTQVYKDRKGSDAGLSDFVTGILAKPVPEFPSPITTLPSEPATTPATNSGTNGSAGTTNGKPAANNTTTSNTGSGANKTGAVTGTTQGGSAKPAASPTPMNKKPRLNHRRA